MTQSQTLQLSEVQAKFCASPAKRRVLVAGRGAGKSYAAAIDLLLRAAKYPGDYLCVAPTTQILKEGMVAALYDLTNNLRILRKASGNPLVFHLINSSRVVTRTAKLPDNLRGGSYSGCVVDEAALCSPWVAPILLATLRQYGRAGWITFASTPKGRWNWLYAETLKPNTEVFTAHTRQNPFVDEEFQDSLIENYDEHFRKQEVEGRFVDDDEESQCIPSAWIESAQVRGKSLPEDVGPLSCCGVDSARGGSSRFTVAHRHGNHLTTIHARPGSQITTSEKGCDLVERQVGYDKKGVLINIDISGGTGSGVFDLLDTRGYRACAMNFGAAPPQGATDATGKYKFANLRSFMYWRLREALSPDRGSQALTLPESWELAQELGAVHWFMNGSSAIQLQPKEQIAKVLRRSPDLADAVALTMLN